MAMLQRMGSRSPAPLTIGLCPQLRADGRRSAIVGSGGRGHRVLMLTGQAARLGKLTYGAPRSKYCPLRVTAIPDPEQGSSLLDKHAPKIINESNLQLNPAMRKDKYHFEVEMTVHDDDIDEYGVVNHAIYASYINTALVLMLEYMGMGADYWPSTGKAFATSELLLKYFSPLRSGDRFIVKIRFVQIKGVRMIMDHLIEALPDRKLILSAKRTAVFLNKDYHPTRAFPEFVAKLQEMLVYKEG